MSESVEILIQADDQASGKLKTVADNVEKQVQVIRETGAKAKASTELVGTLANALGGSQIGGYAGQIAQLTERISAFSEVSKAGGAGALAFRAGLVGAAGVIGFQIGRELGNVIWQTEQWKEQLAAATVEAERLAVAVASANDKRFQQGQEDISLIRDPEDRTQAQRASLELLQKEIAGAELMLDLSKRQVEVKKGEVVQAAASTNAQLNGLQTVYQYMTQGQNETVDLAKAAVEQNKERLTQLREQAKLVQEQLGREAEIAAIKARNAELDRSDAYLAKLREEVALQKASRDEQIAMEATKNVVAEDRGIAEQLLRERDALLARAEAEKLAQHEADAAKQKEIADQERIEALQAREIQRLNEREILITQGAEAAKAYALEMQGLDETTAKALARREAELDDKASQKQESTAQTLQASQGRLLTRGTGDQQMQLLAESKRLNEIARSQLSAALDMVAAQRDIVSKIRPALQLATVE